ncbi:AraC-like DNA-binding protein [Bradyrhizobium sp. USDA 4503]|uniref:helix-turn-helix domain-containing protein n=1 Tax=Bradyrhizobium brasilense TaxID=1419277 RepID=UPI001E548345|nr:AraC family transcriptional regulator [Bradyrhizobium brasilense]
MRKEITLAIFHDVHMKPVSSPSRHSVRAAISVLLRQDAASVRCTARQLGVSVRSLQRHLGGMGTSYSELVTEVRLDTACRLLAESNERISDIALRLGYTGASSFSRSFVRLMKMPPIAYRQQQAAKGNGKARASKS